MLFEESTLLQLMRYVVLTVTIFLILNIMNSTNINTLTLTLVIIIIILSLESLSNVISNLLYNDKIETFDNININNNNNLSTNNVNNNNNDGDSEQSTVTDHNRIPVPKDYYSREQDYGYSYLPPEHWYPKDYRCSHIITSSNNSFDSALTDGLYLDYKEIN